MTRRHDLPPRWDDRIVTWRGWEVQIEAFICPPPRQRCCEACGSLAKPVVNRGVVAVSPATTQAELDYDAENRRRLGRLAHKRPLIAFVRLHVFRCPDCKTDLVWDTDTDEWWTLDDTDYGDDGSVDPNIIQGALF
jgi:hypothetical protein